MRFKCMFLEVFNSKRPMKDVLTPPSRLALYQRIVSRSDLDSDLFEWITTALIINEKSQKQHGISTYFSYLKFWDTPQQVT